jgi:hypothetical protein
MEGKPQDFPSLFFSERISRLDLDSVSCNKVIISG